MSTDSAAEVPEPVRTFIDIVNRHDGEGFLDAFTPDAFVDDWGRVFRGRDAIEEWSDREFIGSLGALSPQTVDEEGGVLTVVGDWRSNHANGLSSFAFTTSGDRLTSMTIREG